VYRQTQLLQWAISLSMIYLVASLIEILNLNEQPFDPFVLDGKEYFSRTMMAYTYWRDRQNFYFIIALEILETTMLILCSYVLVKGIILREGLNKKIRRQMIMKHFAFLGLRFMVKIYIVMNILYSRFS
jgi:hypothetical protein